MSTCNLLACKAVYGINHHSLDNQGYTLYTLTHSPVPVLYVIYPKTYHVIPE